MTAESIIAKALRRGLPYEVHGPTGVDEAVERLADLAEGKSANPVSGAVRVAGKETP